MNETLFADGLAAALSLVEVEVENLRWFARQMVREESHGDANANVPRYVLELKGSPDILTRTAAYAEIAAAVPREMLAFALAQTLPADTNANARRACATGCRIDDHKRRDIYIGAVLAYESAVLNDAGRQLDVSALMDAIPQPQRDEVERTLEFLSALNHYFDTKRRGPLDS